MSKPLQIVWVAVVLFGLGSGFGTHLHRVSRLPSWFWLPCVSGAACLVSYALFFVFFFSPGAGRFAALICWAASVVLFARACWDPEMRRRLGRRDAWLPGLLTALLTASYLASAFAIDTSINRRFRFPVPGDNELPQRVAAQVLNGMYGARVTPAALEGGWRVSDRPPLQAALILASLPLQQGDRDRFAQFTATLAQMGWVAALYALGRTIALPRRYLQFVLAAAAASPFFFFNSVYTWPKLLAAWLCVTGLAIVIHVVREKERASAAAPVLAAGAIALGLLAHGGIAFSVVALPILAVWWKPWRNVRPGVAIAAAAVMALLLAPWAACQRFYDPPGNRLLKLHFAGVEDVDARGTWEAIRDAYRGLDWRTYVEGRWANMTSQWFGTYPLPFDHAIDWVQWQQLMRHVPLVGFLCVGYIMLVWTPARADLPDASLALVRQLTWYALATAALWIVVMIVPGSTIIHQGSYVMTFLLLFGAAVLTAMLPPFPRRTILSLQVLLFATCYLFSTRTSAPTPVTWRPWTFVAAGAALAAFFVTLRAVPEPTSD